MREEPINGNRGPLLGFKQGGRPLSFLSQPLAQPVVLTRTSPPKIEPVCGLGRIESRPYFYALE